MVSEHTDTDITIPLSAVVPGFDDKLWCIRQEVNKLKKMLAIAVTYIEPILTIRIRRIINHVIIIIIIIIYLPVCPSVDSGPRV